MLQPSSPSPLFHQPKLSLLELDQAFYQPIISILRINWSYLQTQSYEQNYNHHHHYDLELKNLELILRPDYRSILNLNPFTHPINIDFGFGSVTSLNDYGVQQDQLTLEDGPKIDCLYLFEEALRNDALLTDKERYRRWALRLDWENIESDSDRVQSWVSMSQIVRARLGIADGGLWTFRLQGVPVDPSLGYYRSILGRTGFLSRSSNVLRKSRETLSHYPLSGRLKDRYPMWRDCGFGLGRSLLNWLAPSSNPAPLEPGPNITVDPSDPKLHHYHHYYYHPNLSPPAAATAPQPQPFNLQTYLSRSPYNYHNHHHHYQSHAFYHPTDHHSPQNLPIINNRILQRKIAVRNHLRNLVDQLRSQSVSYVPHPSDRYGDPVDEDLEEDGDGYGRFLPPDMRGLGESYGRGRKKRTKFGVDEPMREAERERSKDPDRQRSSSTPGRMKFLEEGFDRSGRRTFHKTFGNPNPHQQKFQPHPTRDRFNDQEEDLNRNRRRSKEAGKNFDGYHHSYSHDYDNQDQRPKDRFESERERKDDRNGGGAGYTLDSVSQKLKRYSLNDEGRITRYTREEWNRQLQPRSEESENDHLNNSINKSNNGHGGGYSSSNVNQINNKDRTSPNGVKDGRTYDYVGATNVNGDQAELHHNNSDRMDNDYRKFDDYKGVDVSDEENDDRGSHGDHYKPNGINNYGTIDELRLKQRNEADGNHKKISNKIAKDKSDHFNGLDGLHNRGENGRNDPNGHGEGGRRSLRADRSLNFNKVSIDLQKDLGRNELLVDQSIGNSSRIGFKDESFGKNLHRNINNHKSNQDRIDDGTKNISKDDYETYDPNPERSDVKALQGGKRFEGEDQEDKKKRLGCSKRGDEEGNFKDDHDHDREDDSHKKKSFFDGLSLPDPPKFINVLLKT